MHERDTDLDSIQSDGTALTSPPRTHDTSRLGWHLKDLDPAMASPEFFILSDGDSSIAGGDSVHERDTDLDSIQSDGTALTSPPRTHDTSRLGWHLKDLSSLAENIEKVGCQHFQ